MSPAIGMPSFSKMTYSLLRWTCLTTAPRLIRALVMGRWCTRGGAGFGVAFRAIHQTPSDLFLLISVNQHQSIPAYWNGGSVSREEDGIPCTHFSGEAMP